MLRITLTEHDGQICFRLEGSLTGPWVAELHRCWEATSGQPLRIELTELRYLDAEGRSLLRQMSRAGVELASVEPMRWDVQREILDP